MLTSVVFSGAIRRKIKKAPAADKSAVDAYVLKQKKRAFFTNALVPLALSTDPVLSTYSFYIPQPTLACQVKIRNFFRA